MYMHTLIFGHIGIAANNYVLPYKKVAMSGTEGAQGRPSVYGSTSFQGMPCKL
jgi:hypothetical protein